MPTNQRTAPLVDCTGVSCSMKPGVGGLVTLLQLLVLGSYRRINCEGVKCVAWVCKSTKDAGRYIGDGRDKSAPTGGMACIPVWGVLVGNGTGVDGSMVPAMAVGWLLNGIVGDAYTCPPGLTNQFWILCISEGITTFCQFKPPFVLICR